MRKTFVALSALVIGGSFATSAVAQSININVTTEVDYVNDLEGALSAESSNTIDIAIEGEIAIKGKISTESVGQALVDGKQILRDNTVYFVSGENDPDAFGGAETKFVEVTNTATLGESVGALVNATGNIGVSVGAGDNLAQDNAVALATVQGDNQTLKADIIKLQAATGNTINDGFENGDTIVTNNAAIASGSFDDSNGNIGANVAAGYNIGQQNVLAVAVATGTSDIVLSSANVGVLQIAEDNTSYIANHTNNASVGVVGVGFSGNAGVNAAAGGNLLQNNSLAVTSN